VEEHFSEPEPNVIDSSAGFSVKVLGRNGMRYREGRKSVWMNSEVLSKPRAMLLYKNSIKNWESPDDQVQLNDDERNRIVENIKRAFEACGYELQVTGDFTLR
jgi:Immunity protein 74